MIHFPGRHVAGLYVIKTVNPSLHDVTQYPQDLLRVQNDCVHVEVTYLRIWDDGFGARGWKINAAIGDPEIIASTRETGQRINTSVFVHDVLDHFLCGFGVSGHRSEAMALIQLSMRTGSDPRPDYEQMVREDIFHGRVNGETLISFLPAELTSLLPSPTGKTNREILAFLKQCLGEQAVFEYLVDNFFSLGKAGKLHALESWNKLGLDPARRTEIGLALQALLNRVDRVVEDAAIETVRASISISNTKCIFELHDCPLLQSVYHTDFA